MKCWTASGTPKRNEDMEALLSVIKACALEVKEFRIMSAQAFSALDGDTL
jgi:hypothetical protein